MSQEPIQHQSIPISSLQLQSYNRDVNAILPSTCVSSFEKDPINNSKLSLNFDSGFPQAISKNNLLNITVNSAPSQKNINQLLPTVHNHEENNALKAYLSSLQRSNLTNVNVDLSTLSKFQVNNIFSSLI